MITSPLDTKSTSLGGNSENAIGLVLEDGRVKCNMCIDRFFKRQAELRRHYSTTHAVHKPAFWCQIPSCGRSLAAGGWPFRRGYRLQDHMRTMHSTSVDDVSGSMAWSGGHNSERFVGGVMRE